MVFSILFVDDEADLSELIKMKFRKQIKTGELKFIFALNGVEALDCLKNNLGVDVMITDINMPGMDGLTLLSDVQKHYPHIKSIVVSAYGDMKNIRASMNLGAFDFLTKPFNFGDFEITLSKTLEVVEKQKQNIKILHEKEESLQRSLEDQKQLTKAYEKFIPREFLELLKKKSILEIQLGDHIQKEMTILFSDIRGFTTLSESMSIEENFKFLNSYLSHMVPIVKKNNGFVDKYIGDSIMALFANQADDALQAANDMLEALTEYNAERNQADYGSIKIGIGINTGELMLGTLGDTGRMESTVISDAVNLSSRIEQLTKVYDVPLLISNETFLELRNPHLHALRIIDYVQVKGKSRPVLIYEVFDKEEPEMRDKKLEAKRFFENALLMYQTKEYEEALKQLKECLMIHPTDRPTQIYIERCDYGLQFDS
ncbi:MAG: response regulator [SAR324 cluster bacterium]|nr:response regulator [SAR324 cluster bacterium]